MWIYDGEEWVEEGGANETKRQSEPASIPFDQFMPELQVVEIVQVPRKPVPPFPLP